MARHRFDHLGPPKLRKPRKVARKGRKPPMAKKPTKAKATGRGKR